MSWQAWTVAGLLAGAMTLFVSEKLRYDVIGLLVLGVLLATGIVTPAEGLSGFSNEATVAIAAMFALNAGVVGTGGLDPVVRMLVRIRKPWLLTLSIMGMMAFLGAFIKNTALVATFLPVCLTVCARTRTPPSRVLMPMSFAAQMGGVCTLIGTSSNLLTNSLAKQEGLAGFGVFEFAQLGVVLAIVGIGYMMTIGRWLLPKSTDVPLAEGAVHGKYVTELRVKIGSPLLGRALDELRLGEKYGVAVLELVRGEERMWSPQSQKLAADDVLVVRGEWDRLGKFQYEAGLALQASSRAAQWGGMARRVLVRALIAPNTHLVGQTLAELDFRWAYQALVLAVQRRGEVLRERIHKIRLDRGDTLMILVDEKALPDLERVPGLVVLGERAQAPASRKRAPIAIAILLGVIVVSGLGLLSIVVAALIGCVLMALTGCFKHADPYEVMDWKVIVLLGAVLPLGIAMQKTGLAQHLVDMGMTLVHDNDPLPGLLMVYLLTALLTELMGHNPSVVIMLPIGVSVAHALHVDPTPFVVATAFAAATSFATPVGYPTNTMVYNAGGYRFTDFLKIGVPMIALFCAISMALIPRIWPFAP
ncbi:MAG: SLC13 family permease [Proteobacteria bacterium]|nr:SLC13 family permease [Pseudomonadota bacterium]MBS0464008.1 SLC13 family permease [Pseudomonadota bacterium]